jgi:hypothetical protein
VLPWIELPGSVERRGAVWSNYELRSRQRAAQARLCRQCLSKRLRHGNERREARLAPALLCGDHPHVRRTRSTGQARVDQRHGGGVGSTRRGHGVFGHAGVLAHRHGDEAAATGERTKAHADARLNGIDHEHLTSCTREALLEQCQHRTRGGIAGDHDGLKTCEGRGKRENAIGAKAGGGVFKGEAIGIEHLHAVARWASADGAHAKAGPVSLAHGALQFRVAGVAERLGEPHHRGGAAVRGMGHLVRRHQRQLCEVIDQVPGKGLLRRAEPVVIPAKDLCEFICVRWHVRLFRQITARPFPLARTLVTAVVDNALPAGHDGRVNRTALTLLALAALPSGALGATQWLPQSVVAPQARGTGAPSVAGTDDGRAIAAWATPTGVVITLRTPGGPWYAPTRIPGSTRGATQVSASMTTGGAAAVTWVAGGRVRMSLRPARKRFLPAAPVSASGAVAATPVVSLGGPCTAILAWASEPARGGASSIQSACSGASGRVSAPRAVSAADDDAFTPAVASSRGTSVIVWRSDVGGQHRVRAAVRQRDASFSAPADVSGSSTSVFVDPAVAVSRSGDAIATWTLGRGNDLIAQAATLPAGGVWSRPDDLSRTGGLARGTQIAIDQTGDAVATWARAGAVQAATRTAGQAWGPPADLSDSSATAGSPRLSLSASGAALVTWPAAAGGAYVVQAALRRADGPFGAPATISDAHFPAIAPQGVIGDDGIAPVVWQWAEPTTDPSLALAGVSAATGFAGSDKPGPAVLADLRARPATVRAGRRITVTFGLSQASRVRLAVTPAKGGREAGALTVSGADGANTITLEGGLGGASLGRGRWRITATPRGGTPRSLVLAVR